MEASQNFKSRSRDPFQTCKWGVASDPLFGFLDPDLPIHCISLQVSIAIVKAFLADFWSKIWLGHVTYE